MKYALDKPECPDSNWKVISLLGLSGLISLGLALPSLISPVEVASKLGYGAITSTGKGEFMTLYGGFYVGIAVFLLLSARFASLRPGASCFLALSSTGAFVVRAYTIVAFDLTNTIVYQLLVGEIFLAVVGWLCWYWIARDHTG